MSDSNTYRFSTRDGIKYLTRNGENLKDDWWRPNWGWYGYDTTYTAYKILETEYGINTADQYFAQFAREYLAEMTCDEFVWTSGTIAFMIGQMEEKHA